MPTIIDPNGLYTGEELAELLRGFAKLETLREYGLVGLPGRGYLGSNVLDALRTWCESHKNRLGCNATRAKPAGSEDRPAGAPDRRANRCRVSERRGMSIDCVCRNNTPLESQRDKLLRLMREDKAPRTKGSKGR